MRIIRLAILSYRYFILHFRKYLFLLIALSFGFGVITTLTAIRAGMEENLYFTSQSHYSGDLVILGDGKKYIKRIKAPSKIDELLKSADIDIESIIHRTQLGRSTLYFNGVAVRQKYVIGVDWRDEASYFSNLEYQNIGSDPFQPGSIIISSPVAEQLNVKLGDQVILEVSTTKKQVNTGSFIVSGIVQDRSIFGYFKCYLDRKELNRLILFKEEECSNIGVYLAESVSSESAVAKIHSIFSPSIQTAPIISNRIELDKERDKKWKGTKYFILPLSVYLSEVSDLLLAIELISYFLYVMMLLIIIVSVLVTLRLLLHQREKEIGTMRAIAFMQSEIVLMLLLETVILFVLSVIIGFILARLVIWSASFFSFEAIPSFEIFMRNGKLTAVYSLRTFLVNCGIVLVSLLPAVIWPVYNASRQPLAVVLSGGNK